MYLVSFRNAPRPTPPSPAPDLRTATLKAPPAPATRPISAAMLQRVAAFHQGYASDAAAIDHLASLVDVPLPKSDDQIQSALDTATQWAAAMKPYAGRFPLPDDTPDRFLAALRPDDFIILENVVRNLARTVSYRSVIKADLSSKGLQATITIAPMEKRDPCVTFDIRLQRRAFVHPLAAYGCLLEGQWHAFLPVDNNPLR